MTTPDRSPQSPPDWSATEPWIGFGRRILLALVGGFILLSLIFSINGAVVASGTITVEGNYRSIQHLDGGVVDKILVKNGDRVSRGDPLVTLDATAAAASLAVTAGRINEFLVQKARLEAERADASQITLPASLKRHINTPQLRPIIASQLALFNARRTTRRGERRVLEQQVQQLEDQIGGLLAQLTARRTEARLNDKDLAGIRSLYDKGYASRTRLVAVERETARLDGDVGRLQGEVARTRGAIAEARLKLAQAEKTFVQGVVDELNKVESALREAEENRKTLAARLSRIQIRAPHAGFVHALAVHTIGGVIAPGATVLQIIPIGKSLIVEARVRPQDVDRIHKGQPTTIMLPAFNARKTPRLSGTVASISAAENTDQQKGNYFSVLVDLDQLALARAGINKRLVPGMPAEVFIETGSRSVMSYFLKPLTDAMTYSMREQ